MSNYTPLVNFAAKDALVTADPAKRILGTEFTAELNAIATAITSKLDSSGTGLFADGSVTVPSISFSADTDTGVYRIGANILGFATGGVFAGGFNTTQQLLTTDGTALLPSHTFNADTDTGFYRVGANDFGVSAGGAQIGRFLSTGMYVQASPGTVAAPSLTFLADGDTGFYNIAPNDFVATAGNLNIAEFLNNAGVAQLNVGDGLATKPGLSFIADTDTGIYRVGANSLGFSAAGGLIWRYDNNGVYFGDGSAALPAMSFHGDTDTGIYRRGTNDFALAAGGAFVTAITGSGIYPIDGTAASPSYSFNLDTDTGVYRAGANTLALAAGGVLQVQCDVNGTYFRDGTGALPGISFNNDPDTGFFRGTANQIGIALGGATAGELAQGAFTATLTGMTVATTGTVNYQRIGNLVYLTALADIVGTSNTTGMTLTGIPAGIRPNGTPWAVGSHVTNSSAMHIAAARVVTDTITFYPWSAFNSASSGGFTAAGNKGLQAGWTAVYSVL